MASFQAKQSVETDATTTEASTQFWCRVVVLISNDGAYDLEIGFDNPLASEGKMTIKPGEQFENINISCKSKLYYKGVGGTTAFRVWGVG